MKRSFKRGACPRIELIDSKNGVGYLPCVNEHGETITECVNAPDYTDYALPCSENLCHRAVDRHEATISDSFKQPYVKVCHDIDRALSDDYGADSAENLRLRFDVMHRELEQMITDTRLDDGDRGRYLYHIDARILQAYLPAFSHRAEHGNVDDISGDVRNEIYRQLCEILEDFNGLYSNVAAQVALRRTEVEILALLMRGGHEQLPWPALFREEASSTHQYNHDGYVLSEATKIPFQVKNTDYVTKRGRRARAEYNDSVAVIIHQAVVNLDHRDSETLVTPASHAPREIEHEHDVYGDDGYSKYEAQPRYIAWGAKPPTDEGEFDCQFVQEFGGVRRDGLVYSLVQESRGEPLTIDEMNLLNGATHYLRALIREKQSEQ